jgi:hypothetical protein
MIRLLPILMLTCLGCTSGVVRDIAQSADGKVVAFTDTAPGNVYVWTSAGLTNCDLAEHFAIRYDGCLMVLAGGPLRDQVRLVSITPGVRVGEKFTLEGLGTNEFVSELRCNGDYAVFRISLTTPGQSPPRYAKLDLRTRKWSAAGLSEWDKTRDGFPLEKSTGQGVTRWKSRAGATFEQRTSFGQPIVTVAKPGARQQVVLLRGNMGSR